MAKDVKDKSRKPPAEKRAHDVTPKTHGGGSSREAEQAAKSTRRRNGTKTGVRRDHKLPARPAKPTSPFVKISAYQFNSLISDINDIKLQVGSINEGLFGLARGQAIARPEAEDRQTGPSQPPPRTRTTLELASDVLQHPGPWLRTPNPQLGDRKPIDLIGTEEEHRVVDLLEAVDQGLF
jgi:hypothetical protein